MTSQSRNPGGIDFAPEGVSALIFDCDGTLAETGGLHLRSFRDALSRQGFGMDANWYGARGGLARMDLLERFRADFDIDLDCARAARDSIASFVAMAAEARPVEATIRIVERFRGKLPMAVASNAERPVLLATLTAIGLLDRFDVVVSVTEALAPKPDPTMFRMAADRLGVAHRDCLVFEDSNEGLAAAAQAGMKAIDVRLGTPWS